MNYLKDKRLRTLYSKLTTLADECVDELRDIGIYEDISPNISYEVNTRAKNRLGVCRHRRGSEYYTYHIVGISDWVLEKFSNHDIKNVIIHELLHTIEGCNNHGYKWQDYANAVNYRTNYHITRTENLKDLCIRNGVDYEEFNNNMYKYEITCKKCGATWHKHKLLGRHLLYYKSGNMRHRACGGTTFMIKDIKLGKVIVE